MWNWVKREKFKREKKGNQRNEKKQVKSEENCTVIEVLLPLDRSYSWPVPVPYFGESPIKNIIKKEHGNAGLGMWS